MENRKKVNGNDTSNYPYHGDSISQEDLGDSGVSVDDPRIVNRKNAVREDEKSFKNVQDCDAGRIVDETYRIDDNSDFSTTALEGNMCMEGDPMTPGLGVDYADVEEDIDRVNRKKNKK